MMSSRKLSAPKLFGALFPVLFLLLLECQRADDSPFSSLFPPISVSGVQSTTHCLSVSHALSTIEEHIALSFPLSYGICSL